MRIHAMVTRFIDHEVLSRIRKAERTSRWPSWVAVAYFAKGAAELLPLKRNSRLVVDASDGTVRGGGTSPADLIKLYKNGVRVFNFPNLHAKVFVCGRTAFIGSANVSKNAAGLLQEAVAQTTDRKAVQAARKFVLHLCQQELGPKSLNRLKAIYRPPKGDNNVKRWGKSRVTRRVMAGLGRLRLEHLVTGDYPEGSETAAELGRKAAKSRRKHQRSHFLDEFEGGKDSIKVGDTVVQLVDESDGPKLVAPPGEVIGVKKWSNGKRSCTFVYLEVPKRKRIRADLLARRLGRGSTKRLSRSGTVSNEFAEKLRKVFV